MKKALLTLALCAASLAQAQEPLTYKGVPMGASLNVFKNAFPEYDCAGDVCKYTVTACFDKYVSLKNDKVGSEPFFKAVDECKEKYTFGGMPPSTGMATFIDGKLSSLYFTMAPWAANDLMRALTVRLGDPVIVAKPFTTKGGVSIDNRVPTWETSAHKVFVDYNYLRAGEAGAVFEAPNHRALSEARKQSEAKTKAKDF